MKKIIIYPLLISLMSFSCSRFYTLSNSDLNDADQEKLKIELVNGNEFVTEKYSFVINKTDSVIVIKDNSLAVEYNFSKIKKMSICKYDVQKSIFSGIFIFIGVIGLFGIFLWLTDYQVAG